MTNETRADRGQSGLDRLLLFVLAIIALLLVAPHVLGLVGIEVGADPGGPPDDGATHDLIVLEARGTAIQDGSVGAVRLVVAPSPARDPVDLAEEVVIWVDEESYYLSPGTAVPEGFDGAYRARRVGGEVTVLRAGDDRGELVFDLGETDDVEGVPEFGQRLQAGASATVTIVTPHGETLRRDLQVPGSVDGESVPL